MRTLLFVLLRLIAGMLSKTQKLFKTSLFTLAVGCSIHSNAYEIEENQKDIETAINQSFKPLMEQYGVAGMAIGVIYKGENYEHYYGLQSNNAYGNISFPCNSISSTLIFVPSTASKSPHGYAVLLWLR